MKEDKKLNYEVPLLFSKEEMKLLKATFGGQDNALMKLLRRIFLPSLLDPDVPVEYGSNDMYMDRDWGSVPSDEIKPLILARQEMIKWVSGSLIRLRQMSNVPEKETPEEVRVRMKKDSTR